jgi:hypothetical protein
LSWFNPRCRAAVELDFLQINLSQRADEIENNMRINLGDQDAHKYFQFKIGDKVRVKNSRIRGTVIAGHCYLDSALNPVYYRIKVQFGGSQSYRQSDLELARVLVSV